MRLIDEANALRDLIRDEGFFDVDIGGISLTLDLSNRHERLYAVSIAAGIRYPQADIDRLLIEKLTRPGDIVVDGGANIGVTALQFLQFGAAQVHCFEPHPDLITRLRSLESERLVVHPFALASEEGSVPMFPSTTHNQGSTIEPKMLNVFPDIYEDQSSAINVKTVNLDDCLDFAHVIKLDVEGAELDALKGAKKLLSREELRAVYLEWYASIGELYDLIKDKFPYCYRVFISRETYELVFETVWTAPDLTKVADMSPTYCFSKEAII